MAKKGVETITIKFVPEGDKKLIKAFQGLAKSQSKFNNTVKKTTPATKKATTSLKKYGLQQQRVTKGNSFLSNSFAVIRSKMLLFSFAVSLGTRQLISFAKESAKLTSVERGFTSLAGGVQNATSGLRKLKDATNGTMSEMDLFKQANNAMILGVTKNTDEMAEMFDMAQRLGRALGRDTASSVESLITGIGRQSRLMLDNVGIIVKAEQAYENYAKKLKKSVDELTNAEKRQAFLTEALRAGKEAIAQLGDEQLTAQDKFDKFNATLKDFTSFLGATASPVVLSFLSGTAEFLRQITETGLETAVRHLKDMGISLNEIKSLEKALNIEKASNALLDANDKITSLFENNNKNALISDKQLVKLGANVENLHKGTEKQGKFLLRNVKLSDAQAISSEKVSEEMAKITNENKKYATELIDVANKDKERAEWLRIRIGWNTREFEWYAKILQLTKDRTNAEKLLKNIQSGINKSPDEGADKEIESINALTKFHDDLIRAKGLLERATDKVFEGTKREIEINSNMLRGMKESTDIEAKILDLKRQKGDLNESEVEVVASIIEILEKANEQIKRNTGAEYDAINNKHDLIDALKLENSQKLISASMSDGIITVEEQLAIIKQKILDLEVAKNLEGGNTLSVQQRILTEKQKEIALEQELARIKLEKGQLIVSSMNNVTSEWSKNLDVRRQATLNDLKATSKYEKASSEDKKKLEKEALDKYKGEQKTLFYLNKASSLADVYFNTASAVMKSIALSPLTMGQPMAGIAKAMGVVQAGIILATPPPKFATGGMVGGRRHSAGGTMIEAEQGEFVMSRNAVSAVGIENMNRINQGQSAGGLSVSFTGNVMSQDFIEDEAIPMIKEAIRRGADIGVA